MPNVRRRTAHSTIPTFTAARRTTRNRTARRTTRVEIGTERRTLRRGDGAVIHVGTPHSWRNPGTEVLHFMFDLELIG